MIGLDCNILVQLAFADHSAHERTSNAVRHEIEQGTPLVLTSLVISDFLHVATDPRRFVPPLSMNQAMDWIEAFAKNKGVNLIEPNGASLELFSRWMRQFSLGRKRILDTQLAAILHVHGINRFMNSNPNDFPVFGVFEIIVP